jgi:hypothetical protein
MTRTGVPPVSSPGRLAGDVRVQLGGLVGGRDPGRRCRPVALRRCRDGTTPPRSPELKRPARAEGRRKRLAAQTLMMDWRLPPPVAEQAALPAFAPERGKSRAGSTSGVHSSAFGAAAHMPCGIYGCPRCGHAADAPHGRRFLALVVPGTPMKGTR